MHRHDRAADIIDLHIESRFDLRGVFLEPFNQPIVIPRTSHAEGGREEEEHRTHILRKERTAIEFVVGVGVESFEATHQVRTDREGVTSHHLPDGQSRGGAEQAVSPLERGLHPLLGQRLLDAHIVRLLQPEREVAIDKIGCQADGLLVGGTRYSRQQPLLDKLRK